MRLRRSTRSHRTVGTGRSIRWGRLIGLAAVTTGLMTAVGMHSAAAAAPQPVYAPAGGVADPGVVRTGGDFYAFATGSLAPVHRGDNASGPWSSLGPALSAAGTWASSGGIWAPDAVETPAGWVLYYSAPAKDFGGQRCIGVAVAAAVTGPYRPLGDSPLICPGGRHGADDAVPGRPVAGAGVIDPSPFTDSEGRRFVLYKTQQTPSTIRMLRVNDNGTHWIGNNSRELVQRDGIIENPVLFQRGTSYVLLASRYGYDNCSYATVWLRSSDRWDFSRATENSLLTTSSTGICGPGGADVTTSLDGGWRIFLHGWVCGTGTAPCQGAPSGEHRRVLYAAIFRWDGSTPQVGSFL